MYRLFRFDWVVALAVLIGSGCSGGGCNGCAVDPLPPGGLPADQTIEGGMQVRVTRTGFDAIENIVKAVVQDSFGDGFCVGRQSIDAFVADGEACYRNDCTGGARGCQVDVALQSIDLSVPDPNTFRAHVVVDVSTQIPARIRVLGVTVDSCTMNVTLNDGDVTLDVGFFTRASDGELDIQLQNIDLDLSGFNSSGCGFISSVLDLVVDLLSSPLGNFLVDLLTPTIEDLIRGFLPDPLGIEGVVDLGALIGSLSPGTNALIETKFIPGGYVSLPAEGLSLGVITGFNADEDVSTRTPDLDNEPALCVPPLAAPDFAAPPHNLTTTPRNTFKLDPADAFLGMPDPANDLVVGLSETFLDLTGHHLVTSGAMCLGVGPDLIPQLNLGLVGLLVPSLAELGSEDGEDPLLLVLRPTEALDFTIGEGTEDDPSLTIHIRNLDVDFYAFLFERYVRGFTIRLSMDVGLNLESTVDDMGNPAVEPILTGLSADDIQLTVHNAEFLREGADQLEQVLPSIFDLALPLISDGIGPIALPDISGFTLANIKFSKVVTAEDEFLALNASLVPSMMMLEQFGERHNVPGGALERYVLDHQLPPRQPVDTAARLTSVRTPPPQALQMWMAGAGGSLPEVVIDLDPYDPQGRQLEWSWRLNRGFWRPYTRDTHLVIRERQLALQGHHTVEVKARAVGDPRSVDLSPVRFDIVTDSAGPRILASRAAVTDGVLRVPAHDLVSPDDTIEYAFAAGGGRAEPDTPWTRDNGLPVHEVQALVDRAGIITVFARDELGNQSAADINAGALIGFHGRAQDSGCNCEIGSGRGSGGGIVAAVAVAVLLMMGSGRRRLVAWARAGARRGTARGLLALLALGIGATTPGCSCDGNPGSGPVCEIDADCADACPDGQIGVCFEGECLCSDDVPFGDVGQYSELALSSSSTAWVSAYNRRHGDLMVARWPESGRIPNEAWEFVDGVPDGPVALPESDVRGGIFEPGDDVGLYTSIAVTPSDAVVVSYFDKTHASLKFATNASGAWENHTVDEGTLEGDPELGYEIVGQYSSITVRADDGRPGIAYFAQINMGGGTMRTELRFAAAQTPVPASSADWAIFVVDEITVQLDEPAAGEPDPYIIPEGVGLFVHAARAPDGSPVLAYYDRVNGDLKLARFDPATGMFAAPIVLDGADADVGWYPSVAVDADGVAHVSYVSATTDDLMYVTDAPDAVPELVDSGYRIDGQTESGLPQPVFHFVGDDSAIVLTNAGPVIAYQDATTHELLLAQKNAAGNWEHQTVAGDEDPFAGGYGFYASGRFDGTQVVLSNWVIDQPNYDSWVEIHRVTVVVQ